MVFPWVCFPNWSFLSPWFIFYISEYKHVSVVLLDSQASDESIVPSFLIDATYHIRPLDFFSAYHIVFYMQ